jgi:hypothetical protein
LTQYFAKRSIVTTFPETDGGKENRLEVTVYFHRVAEESLGNAFAALLQAEMESVSGECGDIFEKIIYAEWIGQVMFAEEFYKTDFVEIEDFTALLDSTEGIDAT